MSTCLKEATRANAEGGFCSTRFVVLNDVALFEHGILLSSSSSVIQIHVSGKSNFVIRSGITFIQVVRCQNLFTSHLHIDIYVSACKSRSEAL
jgi:hypothetical protein